MAVRALVIASLRSRDVKELPRKPSGNSAHVKFLGDVVDVIKERTPLKSDDYGIEQTVNGWRIKFTRSKGGSGSLEQRMIVKEIHDDWFLCLPYGKDGQEPPEDIATPADYIKVAKPYELRRTPWDGETIDGITFDYSDGSHRLATKGTVKEHHIVARPWYVDEIIVAATSITGGTDQQDLDAQDLVWEDTNSASHAWAMVDVNDTGGITPESLNVRSVSALLPIKSSGGTRPVISMAASGVTPGIYGSVTVDIFGRVVAGTAGGGAIVRQDFNGISRANATRKMYFFYETHTNVLALDPTGLGSGEEFADGNYAILWSNGSGSNFGAGPAATLAFVSKFYINIDSASVTALGMEFLAAVTDPDDPDIDLELYFWNVTLSQWDLITTAAGATPAHWITGSVSNIADYLTGNTVSFLDKSVFYAMLVPSHDAPVADVQEFLIKTVFLTIEGGSTASNGEQGASGGGGVINPTDNFIPIRVDATTFDNSRISQNAAYTKHDGVFRSDFFATPITTTTLDSDNLTRFPASTFFISSDDATAANRTFHISDGDVANSLMLLVWSGANAGELLASDSNLILSADWIPVDGDQLQLMWDAIVSKWREQWRYPFPSRFTKAQRNNFTAADGLIIYQTDNTPGLRVYENGAWVSYAATADP